jgi:error-prone DNA polymerase
MRAEDVNILLVGRKNRFNSVDEIRKTGLSDATLEKLADADAFRSINHDRRQALWEVSTKEKPLAIYRDQSLTEFVEEGISLPEMSTSEHVVHDYAATSLSLKGHPVSFVREQLNQLHVLTASGLNTAKEGENVKVAGLILVRQRPGTANGICFITLEDETGTANIVVFPNLFNQYRKEIIQSRLLMVEGKLQREGEVIHVIVKRCFNFSKLLQRLIPDKTADSSLNTRARSDETSSRGPDTRDKSQTGVVQENIFPEGRNFR